MTAPVPGGSLQAAVVDDLGRQIATHRVPAGSVLNPDALNREFGVSRSVVREALRTLEALGMTSARPRIGTVVRPAADWDLLDARVIAWRASGPEAAEQLADLLLLRRAVEPMVAGLAARHATTADAARLTGLCDRLEVALAARDASGFAAADSEFHHLLVHAAGSPVLRQLSQTLQAALQSRYLSAIPVFGEGAADAVAHHRQLADAIQRHDPAAAQATATDLVNQAQSDLHALG